jgi:cellulose synthase/poly-beta-1,6-N-acetylglucosamine synthase-like glycosyltransferase
LQNSVKAVSVSPMAAFRTIQIIIAIYAICWAAYVVLMPLLALIRRPRGHAAGDRSLMPTIAVIVPAHNMEATIGDCIAAIKACDYPRGLAAVHVVADHCEDATARLAREAGATVLVRDEPPAGKTYAIAWALRSLTILKEDPDLYVITDATARLDRGFLAAIAGGWRAGEDVVVGHSILAVTNRKWFAKCLGLTLVHRNLQNWARQGLGLSALIEGRGMAYSRRYIREFGWRLALPGNSPVGQHPTEDWRHGVRIVEHGHRVAYEDDAKVFTPFRDSLAAATEQGIRWERGRQLNAITYGLKLLLSALRRRDKLSLFTALDAIQPPVAILGVLCTVVAAMTIAVPGGRALDVLGLAPLVLIAIYGVQVTFRGRKDGIPPATVAWAPVYLLWRLSAFVLAWTPIDKMKTLRNRSAR